MRISLSSVLMDTPLVAAKTGDVLTVNGEAFDFSGLPIGGTIPAGEVPCNLITGPVERDEEGVLHLTLILPCRYDAPQARLYPHPIIDPADGPISFPGD